MQPNLIEHIRFDSQCTSMHGSLISHAFFGRILWWLAITSDTYTNSNACLLQWLDHSVCHTQLVFPFWVSILILLPITNDTGPVPLAILPSTNRCLTSSQLLTYTLIPFCKFYSSGSNIVTIQCLFALSCSRRSLPRRSCTFLCLLAFQLSGTPEALWISAGEVAQFLMLLCIMGKRVEHVYLSNHVS